ncbi:hypothetical protein RchiOBHm_Chr1g0328161 [Rosa chinensis]|uniref:Uncharacterized protein n=1 Tax=Rosa chinensis TaxID=74649 RepID=A0A2P6SAS6_ROSCH|nr:hypothetical protein RchiOBHm_Chr1g0328161 [Rosa chinensis]
MNLISVGWYRRCKAGNLEVKQVSGTQLLYRICGSGRSSGSAGFEEKRDSAFDKLEIGIKNGSVLFCTGSYESVYILG